MHNIYTITQTSFSDKKNKEIFIYLHAQVPCLTGVLYYVYNKDVHKFLVFISFNTHAKTNHT